tara:strand:- start:2776 stop:3747 length:972 start_codon:yes stop_codon:yes gene_type:complete
MILPDFNTQLIIKQLPHFKLSYETVIHNKVYKSDMIYAVPHGTKCLAWFTYHLSEPICYILELDDTNKICNIKIGHVSCNPLLSLGTLFYGTIIHTNFFTIEDIFWFKGVNVSYYKWNSKFDIIHIIMQKDLHRVDYSQHFVIFGLPILSDNVADILIKIKQSKYTVKSLQFMLFHNSSKHLCFYLNGLNTQPQKLANKRPYLNTQSHKVFYVTADVQNDIYHLFCHDDKFKLVYCNNACVPTYECSVLLNNLFRFIKENGNLDTLEESDDEDDFQCSLADRFVDLNKTCKMVCEYNHKFKKWTPIKLTTNNESLCMLRDLPR